MFSCLNGHELCAPALLEAGADPNEVTDKGFTALILSGQNGHGQCARALLEAGADLEAENNNQVTALNAACYGGHEECALALLHAGANPDVKDAFGDSPRTIAEERKMERVLTLMQ